MQKKCLGYALALSTIVPAGAAQATQTVNVNMYFQSGASFAGTVDFADDYSSYSDVAGILFGYQGGNYTGFGSTVIDWVWDGTNRSSGTDNFSNWLMDTDPTYGYTTWIQLAYNYSDPNNLTFTNGVSYGGYDNTINYSDPLVEGSFSQLEAAVPEPSTWAMMLFGFFGLGLAIRRQRAQRPVASLA